MQSHSKLRNATSILSTLLAGLAVAATLAACSAGVEADAGDPEQRELGTEQNAMMRSPGNTSPQLCATLCKQTYIKETTGCDYTSAPDQDCMEPPRVRLVRCLLSCPGSPTLPTFLQ